MLLGVGVVWECGLLGVGCGGDGGGSVRVVGSGGWGWGWLLGGRVGGGVGDEDWMAGVPRYLWRGSHFFTGAPGKGVGNGAWGVGGL